MEVIYKCRYCRKEYAEADDALKCEGRHIPIETIENAYWSMYDDDGLYAHTIYIKFIDGHIERYDNWSDD